MKGPTSICSLILRGLAALSVGVLGGVIIHTHIRSHGVPDRVSASHTLDELECLAYYIQSFAKDYEQQVPEDANSLYDFYEENNPSFCKGIFAPRGWLEPGTNVFVDDWRNPLRLVAESPRRYKFISPGANEKDENGKGDDIVYYFDPLEMWEQTDRDEYRQRQWNGGCRR